MFLRQWVSQAVQAALCLSLTISGGIITMYSNIFFYAFLFNNNLHKNEMCDVLSKSWQFSEGKGSLLFCIYCSEIKCYLEVIFPKGWEK